MSEIISLAAQRAERSPHLAGKARCLACKHEWAAVAPIGTISLDCPSCGCGRGAWRYPFAPDVDQQMFVCNCGADHFVIQPHRALCISCGASHEPWPLHGATA